MSNPVLARLRQNLAAGARRAEADAARARSRLESAGGTAENEIVRVRVDAMARLVEVTFQTSVALTTPGGWSAAVLSAYAAACEGISPLAPQDAADLSVHRPGADRGGAAERSRRLAEALPTMVAEAEQDGVRVSLTGRQQLTGATASEAALLGGPERLQAAFDGARRTATAEIEARTGAVLDGTNPRTGTIGGDR